MSNCTVDLPRPDDQLWIITGAAVQNHGIGAALSVTREGKLLFAGFFALNSADVKVRGYNTR